MADSDGEIRPPADLVDLADAIAALRAQLSQATSTSSASGPRFKIAEIEMEFSVEAVAGGDGQVTFWVVGADAGGSVGNLAGHRVTIKLTPAGDDGGPHRVSRGWDEGGRMWDEGDEIR